MDYIYHVHFPDDETEAERLSNLPCWVAELGFEPLTTHPVRGCRVYMKSCLPKRWSCYYLNLGLRCYLTSRRQGSWRSLSSCRVRLAPFKSSGFQVLSPQICHSFTLLAVGFLLRGNLLESFFLCLFFYLPTSWGRAENMHSSPLG